MNKIKKPNSENMAFLFFKDKNNLYFTLKAFSCGK